jgi:hypothetical protein
MNPFERRIATMIGAIYRHWRRRQLQAFAVLAALALTTWLLAMIVLDNTIMLSSGELLLGWGILAGGIIVAIVGLLGRLTVARPSAPKLACLYEARVPGQHNRLINAVQFMTAPALRADPLVQAAIAENATTLELDTAPGAVDRRSVQRLLVGLGIVAGVALAYAIVRPYWVMNGLARVLEPLNPAPHLLATEPNVRPGDAQVNEGDALTIDADVQASLRGGRPGTARLEYRIGSQAWTQVAMARVSDEPGTTGGASFRHTFAAVWQPLDYRVRAGWSVSPTYHVTTRTRPRVSELQVTVTRPAYAGGTRRALAQNTGDVSALIGSTINVLVTASTPLSAAAIELTGGNSIPLEVKTPTGTQGQFILERSGSYAIRLTDQRGLANVNPPRYTLTAEPDQTPVVAVTRPGRDLILPANARLDLRIEAEDDIGLARVALQLRHGTAAWADWQEFEVSAQSPRRQVNETTLDLSALGLQGNEVLLYRAVATDRREPAPNVGVGRAYSITVATADEEAALRAAQTRRLLEALQRILALQRENRTAFDLDRPVEPVRARQQEIRDSTTTTIEQERQAPRPHEAALTELNALVDGPMLDATQLLAGFGGEYKQRFRLKLPILAKFDEIIARLEALVARLNALLAQAEKAERLLGRLPVQEREQALKDIRALLDKLEGFLLEQDRVITGSEELARKGADLTDADRQKIEELKQIEDKWAEVFGGSVKDIEKLTEQGFADRSIANDYKDMVEQIEAASLNLTPQLIQLAVPREQSGREMAEALVEEMEMWLPNSPDHIQWIMEEPLDFPEIPMVDLPDQLWDLIGDLIESQDELNDEAEDWTSAWADSLAEGAGWEVQGGPISNFSAVGKTGNQLPDNNELSGRAGEGRSGRSQGQLVENVVRGLEGRHTPTRITNDAYEQGVVRELRELATGGATGGGKARGSGQEGLQGQSPPPSYENLRYMRDWQQRIRQEAQRVVGQLQMVRVNVPSLEKSIALMRGAEQAAAEGRYADMFKIQQMVLQNLRLTGELGSREMALEVARARQLPANQRRQILDALDEPTPEEYQAAVRRYFQQLSEGK